MMGLDADIGASGVLWNPHTFKGAGQVIAVNDSGFDTGSMGEVPPAFTGRILAMKNAQDPSLSVANTGSHGTAVPGSPSDETYSTVLIDAYLETHL